MLAIIAMMLLSAALGGTHAYPPCDRAVSVPLPDDEIQRFRNGSVAYNGVIFPRDSLWMDKDENVLYGCPCNERICIRKCCPVGTLLKNSPPKRTCEKVSNASSIPKLRPSDEELEQNIQNISSLEDYFYVVENMICPGGAFMLTPEEYSDDEFVLLSDGRLSAINRIIRQRDFCMDRSTEQNGTVVLICDDYPADKVKMNEAHISNPIGMLISITFLIATFVVYVAIPELRNLYGKTLMCYVVCLLSAYSCLVIAYFLNIYGGIGCIVMAFVIQFSFLASFFWLNVMCFDIWWTFGGFRSLQGSVKQRERRKFMMYSIYAWGSASFLTAICIAMDFIPGIPDTYIKPQFGKLECWYYTNTARALYFYLPMGVLVLCNICLFISTAMKIVQHKRDTAHHLRGTDSRRHDDNKQWFNLYLKLFIVMGISWAMEIISWLCKDAPKYVWYITDLGNTLQGLIIFIIFVCKKKIKRLLLKRFGFQDGNFLSRNSTRSTYHSSASRSCTTSLPLSEKPNPYADPTYRSKPAFDDSDGA